MTNIRYQINWNEYKICVTITVFESQNYIVSYEIE